MYPKRVAIVKNMQEQADQRLAKMELDFASYDLRFQRRLSQPWAQRVNMSSVSFKPIPVQEQLSADWSGSRFLAFSFPLTKRRVSVQAGYGIRSSFFIANMRRDYPFFQHHNADWNLESFWEFPVPQRLARMEAERRLFPINSATHFEV